MSVSSKFVSFNNYILQHLFNQEDLNYKHISLVVYLKDLATLEEGNIKYIKSISVKEINNFLRADTKYRTARKLLEDLLSHSELFLVDKDTYNFQLLVKNTQSFSITLEEMLCCDSLTLDTLLYNQGIYCVERAGFTKVPEALLHLYPEGVSTYLAIRYTHSEKACIDITRLQKMSKVKRRNTQLEILNKLEDLGFIKIIKDRKIMRNKPNKYICLSADEIEFERRYNKYHVKKKPVEAMTDTAFKSSLGLSNQKDYEVNIGEWDFDI